MSSKVTEVLKITASKTKTTHHFKCRNSSYLCDKNDSKFERGRVPDDKIAFSVEFNEYSPVEFTSKNVLGVDGSKPVWADPPVIIDIKFNQIDGKIDRRSLECEYEFDSNGRPLNIVGRTGVSGRGMLGKWGPNHAADPVVTRFKRNDKGDVIRGSSGKPIMEFVAIQRGDTKEWAIPGGMCDPGEPVSLTLKREFMEEAANSTEKNEHAKEIIDKKLEAIFSRGVLIYEGYVDDPRNTDNAWMETQCYNFHDDDGTLLKDFKLEAGDDARKVKWMEINSSLKLYASHKDFILKIVKMRDAHWDCEPVTRQTIMHNKCRGGYYIGAKLGSVLEKILREIVPDEKVPWSVPYDGYKPFPFTSIFVYGTNCKKPVWADFAFISDIKFNQIDNGVDRRSHEGKYCFDIDGRPLNYVGRTGISGRGLLGKWGPNHAADPVVSRWKRDEKGNILRGSSGKPILQFVAIERADTKEWAIPGGMCDPGEPVSLTLKREFMEEAANSTEKSEKSKEIIEKKLEKIFSIGKEIYKGYVDDPRNTDNAWMETQCFNFHDETGELLKDFKLEAGDDARKVKWMDVDANLKLYASHTDFIKRTVDLHGAHW